MPRWSDTLLTDKRKLGDPIGDEAIRQVFERRQVRELNAFMGALVGNDTIPETAPPEVAAFLRDTSALPAWADRAQIERAEALFNRHGLISLVTLVCASLPECYTMRTGVRILDLTRQLGEHTNRRIHQTAVMVLAVMAPGGLSGRGTGLRNAQKVRLIHSSIRYRILGAMGSRAAGTAAGTEAVRSVTDVISRHGFDWDIERDGWPINQEDLAFTLLTFGHIIPVGMRRLGVPLSDEDHRAFLHAWNVVGSIMGVHEELMAHTAEEADELFHLIHQRQAGPSPEGMRLTAALVDVVHDDLLPPPFKWLAPVLVRMLVGDRTAAMLGLNTRYSLVVRTIHRAVAASISAIDMVFARLANRLHPLRPLATFLGQRVVDLLYRVTYRQSPVTLQIPAAWRA